VTIILVEYCEQNCTGKLLCE